MIPKKWDMDKFMYYVEGTGIAWVDYNKEGIQLNPQHQSVMDMSIKTIQQYVTLLESILVEWEKISGVSRQRQGEIGAYEGKATSQQAILQSSHITEDLFRKFNRLEQRDLQALLDYSKEAWITGKKTMYIMPDGTLDYLAIDPLSHVESDYGVFVTDSGSEQEKLQKLEGLSQAMIQNGVPASTVADMIDTQSFSHLKSKIRDAEKAMQELAQQQQQAQQEFEQSKVEAEQSKVGNENNENEKDRQSKLEIAELQSETTLQVAEMKSNTDSKKIESESLNNDSKNNLEKTKISESSRTNKESENIEREGLKSKEKIEKSKAKKQSQNKSDK
jgi:hypothetical protein